MKVRYTRGALTELTEILAYIEQPSPDGANRVRARIKSIVGSLSLHPRIGTQTNDPKLRRLIAHPYPYAIFYEVTRTWITIHAIRHTARDPAGMPGAS